MGKMTKRRKANSELLGDKKGYSLEEAINQVENFAKTKFDETVELHMKLNIDPKSSDQMVRGKAVLPHGTGKKIKIAVFCKGENLQKAQALGADYVGAEDLIEKVSKGLMDFDSVIATPDMMRDLSKLGKVLGPRGLMPSPKTGTVTQDVEKVINEVRAGRVEFKSDKQGGIHVGFGKRSFGKEKLMENAKYIMDAINHAKPSTIKGDFFKSLSISTTMGPGLKISL